MDRTVFTALELDVLYMRVGDAERQLTILTDVYHGQAFTPQELHALKQIAQKLVELSLEVTLLRKRWRERVSNGQEPNRSDTGRADAAGPARPSDDVPPSTTR